MHACMCTYILTLYDAHATAARLSLHARRLAADGGAPFMCPGGCAFFAPFMIAHACTAARADERWLLGWAVQPSALLTALACT